MSESEQPGPDRPEGPWSGVRDRAPAVKAQETDQASEESGPERINLIYTGQWWVIFQLSLVNLILSLLTLGIYSFWGRTRIRRYLWSHTFLNGSPLEYHGTGGQIFLGFIIISAVFFGFNLGYEELQGIVLNYAIESLDGSVFLAVTVPSLMITAVFYLTFLAYVFWSSRRYWLAMTSVRGIRMRQTGRRWQLIRLAFPRAVLTALTLGFAYPWLVAKTEAYTFDNSHWGDRQITSRIDPTVLLKRWWIFNLLLLCLVATPILISSFHFIEGLAEQQRTGIPMSDLSIGETFPIFERQQWLLPLLMLFGPLSLLFSWSVWRRHLYNHVISSLDLGSVWFRGAIKARSFVWAYVLTIILFALTQTIAAFLFPTDQFASLAGGYGPFVAGFLIIFVSLSIWGFWRNIFVVHGLWYDRIKVTWVHGTIDVAQVKQGDVKSSRHGEGLGMVFEGGFGEA